MKRNLLLAALFAAPLGVLRRKPGTVSFSWGEWGGFYRDRAKGEYLSTVRVCCGWVAITYIGGIEIDDLMRGYGDAGDLLDAIRSYFDGLSPLTDDHRALYEAFERAGRP